MVLHHAGQGSRAFVAPLPPLVDTLATQGYLGVDFFFVLSGFLIWTVGAGRPAGAFVRARLIRVFVPYLPVALALALAYTLLPGLSASGRDWGWGASLTLLPFPAPPALSVAWSLQHELVFYLWFALLLRLGALGPGLAAWGLAIVGLAAWGGAGRSLGIVLGPLNLEFLMGVVAARGVDSRVPSWACLAVAALGFGGFLASGALEPLSPLAGLGFAGLIVPLVRAERAGALRVPRALVALGDASFALYLLHNPVISLTSRLCAGSQNWVLALAVAVIAALAAGLAYHRLIERPILKQVRRIFMRDASIRTDPATLRHLR